MRIYRNIPERADRPVALTIGNFDGVHLGHQAMLARLVQAARTRGLPACVMTFEPHPREFFAPDQAPTRITSLREKLELLAGCGVDRVYVCRFDYAFAQITAEAFIDDILRRGLDTCYLLVGDDFRFGARRAGDFAMLQTVLGNRSAQRGVGVAAASPLPNPSPQGGGTCMVEAMESIEVNGVRVSSTAIREALVAGNLDGARMLLGRPYSISGRVVGGDKLGKQIGFPTANVQMKHNRPPLSGIFVVEVHGLGEVPLPGAASLGVRPTVHEKGKAVLEVHLLDFDRRIYGKHLRVDFLKKLRDEEKYPDLPTLTAQIMRDVENTRNYFVNRKERQGR
ncbi:MAG: bifunctional riboflavin kinase/FAD synthetase [Pseudomonadota bacterium]